MKKTVQKAFFISKIRRYIAQIRNVSGDLLHKFRMADYPLTLAVETSAPTGSVALAGGPDLLGERFFSGPMRHGAELFVSIAGLLNTFGKKPADIEQVYISIGPGSFTGLRIAVTLAKAMHLANSAKIVAVDTMDVLAANVDDYVAEKNTPVEKIATITDAKRGRFFIAAYRRHSSVNNTSDIRQSRYEKILPDCLMSSSEFIEKFSTADDPIWLLGVGLVYYQPGFMANGIRFIDSAYWNPRASKVHQLGWKLAQAGRFSNAATVKPLYLRHPQVAQNEQV